MLNKLEDYVFLSDRNSQINFLVERDGTIWRPDEFPEAYFVAGRRKNILCNWKTTVKDDASWRWRKGYLPVLEICDGHDLLELLVDGDVLLGRINGEKVFVPGSDEAVHPEKFSLAVDCLENFWDDFFAKGRQLPELPGFLAAAWKACFVQALNSFCGRHPKYGVGYYNRNYHDGFPPTIISMVDTLLEYQHYDLALSFMSYYLKRFILSDGSIDYYGPALSEYGMLLEFTDRIIHLPDGQAWLEEHLPIFKNMVRYLYRAHNIFVNGKDTRYRLFYGAPEADTRDAPAVYTHNNAWIWRGLCAWSNTAAKLGHHEAASEASREAADLYKMLNKALSEIAGHCDLTPSRLDCLEQIKAFDQDRNTAYANSRYYPELLQSMFLPDAKALDIIAAREQRGGELAGMTLFHFAAAWQGLSTAPFCCNNWAIAAYGKALARLGEKKRLERLLEGHFRFHQTHDTFTAYENVDAETGKIRRAFTDWCVPAQLVFPRILKWYSEM